MEFENNLFQMGEKLLKSPVEQLAFLEIQADFMVLL